MEEDSRWSRFWYNATAGSDPDCSSSMMVSTSSLSPPLLRYVEFMNVETY